MQTMQCTVAQALIQFLDQQYIRFDGREEKFVDGVATIFGHGIVLGLGQALDAAPGRLNYYQGKNEQGMAHMAAGFAKQHNRRKIIACASSIGPGAANMVTAAACASVNNIPLLLLPGDAFSTRQPDPVLQQLEQEYDDSITTNDAFRPVCKYWARINRPEQLMSAMIHAMRVLTDPAQTGAVCVALPQDVQGEAYAWPESFLTKRVHKIPRALPPAEELEEAVRQIKAAKRPLVICGGGVRYSEAGLALTHFCRQHHIPIAETQAGKSAMPSDNSYNLGGIGVTGNSAANEIAKQADLIIAVGSRLSDFTTSSKWLFREECQFLNINVNLFHAQKLDAAYLQGDARAVLESLQLRLAAEGNVYQSEWGEEIAAAKAGWAKEMAALAAYHYEHDNPFETIVQAKDPASVNDFIRDLGGTLTQTEALCLLRERIAPDAIVVGASGSLPGDMQRMWETNARDSYHMEYGYSCMGYEIAAALGCKLADPTKEVYAMVGDGSFLMLHSELVTAIQEGQKINVVVFDNAGFGCINNLEMNHGVGNFGTEFRCRDERGNLSGAMLNIDYAGIGEALGAVGFRAKNKEDLIAALEASKNESRCTVIDLKVLPKTMTDGYGSWWNCGVSAVNVSDKGAASYAEIEAQRRKAKQY
ncbi:MAG: 3D-(3,5/4)-trihydroxycyclohexane-1,2-dione acylhydrolase (decyclizing) [Oscillospiraceae bacterium]|jgi:3D-(3,5/4)-trihydroxycyclohexane-1,2-dione acylhydrolase (decyclizing)|nr:3D-(3,5/4)-trihydroxycyclohexane-1,2-dione acylhydrolase (decyclizing) [Oscillospiraceae bacterium]